MNLVGEILNDSWILLKRIGQGSFSEIYLAQNVHLESNNYVAIKVQRLQSITSEVVFSSSVLKWEAEVLKSIRHIKTFPKYIHYDSYQSKEGRGDRYEYITMEYLSGEDMSKLRDITRETLGYIPIPIVFYLTLQMLTCIKNLHSRGLVHRDIKPANFVRRHNNSTEFCMLDFGIAKQHREKSGNIRMQREDVDFRGTSVYASPHAHTRIDLSPRDDIYSLFFVFLDLLGGKLIWSEAARSKEKSVVAELKQMVLKEDSLNYFLDLCMNAFITTTATAPVDGSIKASKCTDDDSMNTSVNSNTSPATYGDNGNGYNNGIAKGGSTNDDLLFHENPEFRTRLRTQCVVILTYLKSLQFEDFPDYDLLETAFYRMLVEPSVKQHGQVTINGNFSNSHEISTLSPSSSSSGRLPTILREVGNIRYNKYGFSWMTSNPGAILTTAESVVVSPSYSLISTIVSGMTDVHQQQLQVEFGDYEHIHKDASINRMLSKPHILQNILYAKGKFLGRQINKALENSKNIGSSSPRLNSSTTVVTSANTVLVTDTVDVCDSQTPVANSIFNSSTISRVNSGDVGEPKLSGEKLKCEPNDIDDVDQEETVDKVMCKLEKDESGVVSSSPPREFESTTVENDCFASTQQQQEQLSLDLNIDQFLRELDFSLVAPSEQQSNTVPIDNTVTAGTNDIGSMVRDTSSFADFKFQDESNCKLYVNIISSSSSDNQPQHQQQREQKQSRPRSSSSLIESLKRPRESVTLSSLSSSEQLVRKQQLQQKSLDISYGVTWKCLVQELMSVLSVEQVRRETIDLFESLLRDFNRFYYYSNHAVTAATATNVDLLSIKNNMNRVSNGENNSHSSAATIDGIADSKGDERDWQQFVDIQKIAYEFTEKFRRKSISIMSSSSSSKQQQRKSSSSRPTASAE